MQVERSRLFIDYSEKPVSAKWPSTTLVATDNNKCGVLIVVAIGLRGQNYCFY